MTERDAGYHAEKLLSRLFKELRRLRAYHAWRKNLPPLSFILPWRRRALTQRLIEDWRGAYALLDNGDYFYISANLDAHGLSLLTRPFAASPLVEKFCVPGSHVLDIGANIGEWSLPMARQVGPAGRLHAFEPIPFMNDALNRTLRVNGQFHASAYQVALSNADGNATFHVNFRAGAISDTGSSSLERPGEGEAIEVKTATLDGFLAANGINGPISFAKIDVEGHEYAVIEGAKETLARHRPVLVMETGHDDRPKRERIASVLRPLEYELAGIILENGILPATWEHYLDLAAPFSPGRSDNTLLLPARHAL